MAALRVLTFTTLYPNAERPNHGVFVENRLRQTVARHDMQATILAPVPYFPFKSHLFGRYSQFARTPAREMRHGVSVHHPRFLSIPKIGMTVAPWLLYRGALGACRTLNLDKSSIDVVDAHYFYPDGVAAALLAQALDVPFVVTARGSDLNLLAQHPRVRRQIVWAAEQAAVSITVSAALRERLLGLGADRRKSAVLRNGVDLDLFAPKDRDAARRKFGVSTFTIASVGNLVPLKGHHLAIDAMKALPDCTLLIAGGGPLKDALQARAAALGLGERVQLLGEVPHRELAQLYSAADALVLMSEREGWANVLLEAMACGTPTLATRVGGNAEIIAGLRADLLLPERSSAALAAAVRALRANTLERGTVRRYAEAFGWAAVAAGNFALLSAAANGEVSSRSASDIAQQAMQSA